MFDDGMIEQIIQKRYERLEKMNTEGQFTKAINWYKMTNLFHAMITPQQSYSHSQTQKDYLKQYADIALQEMEKLLMANLRKKQIEKKIAAEIKNSIDNALLKLN